jgi:uncharacterized repeat protein (TIGR01451 family)
MKSSRPLRIAITLFAALAPFVSQATVFFSDTFTNGSTINSATPANPTLTNTAYQVISAKTYSPTPTISSTSSDLRFGIASTSSGAFEIQALFATNPIALVLPGDYIRLTIVFTNTTGLLALPGPGSSQLGIGLYNSGQAKPLPGGASATTLLTNPGNANNWLGYVGQITSGANRIMTRPSQATAIDGWNQEVALSGSSTATYRNQVTVGSTVAGTVTLTTNAPYTEVLTITMNDVNSLAITNTLYSGPNTSGTVITNFGGIATNTTFLTGGFDAFALGYQTKVAGNPSLFDVSSVTIDGSVTAITGPPTIDQQPVDVTVPNGGSCAFSVAATGFNVTYQWHRNGTNLLNGGNISGATSSQLVISPAGPGDVLSGANGYYVTVTGAGPFSTNSEVHSLAFGTANNLIYSGSGNWDLNTSASWVGGLMFNYGDAVTFDDTGAGGTVPLVGSYLSASSVTVNAAYNYIFNGSGSFAGPGKLIYTGANQFEIQNANTYSGGTIVSNATANLRLKNLAGLGTGPITFAAAGSKMTVLTASSSSTSINSDLIVADDATIVLDPVNTSFGMVLNGNLSGTASKTLTINHGANGSGTNATRIRINGTNTVCNANLNLNDSTFVWSPSQGSGSQTYNGVISGTGSVLQKNSTTYLNSSNTYSGGTTPAAGSIGLGIDSSGPAGSPTDGPIGTGPLLLINDSTTTLLGSGTVFASGGARTIGNPIQYVNSSNNITLIIGGTNSLTFSGPFSLQGNDGLFVAGTNRIIQADNTAGSTLSGIISDGGFGIGLVKTGTNTLYLNGANTYTGPTTVTNGTLAGTGTIAGAVTVLTNAAIGGGSAASIGTLNITGNLIITNGGGGFFRVNRAGASSDQVSVSGNINSYGNGTITVANLGATLQPGDKFNLFNSKAVTGGATLNVTGGGVAWTNNLAVDGSISVAQPADVGVTVSGPTSASVGAIAYTITVTNNGPGTATGILVTNTMGTNVTFVSATGSGATNGHPTQVVWTGFNLAANAVTNFTLNVTAVAGTATNTVSAASASADPSSANNSATLITTVIAGTDLAVTESGTATVGSAGTINYTIVVTNQGAATASSVVVTDALPAGVTFVSANAGGVNNAGVVSWAISSLNSAQGSNLTLTVTAPATSSIITVTNPVSVSSATTELVPANNTAQFITTVLPPPVLLTQPTSRAVAQGSTATLTVVASTSTGSTNYTWQMNSNTIAASNASGIATSTLTITNFQAANAGYYRAVVSDGLNAVTNSNNARLTLAVSPGLVSSGVSGTTFTLQIPTEIGPSYLVQTNANLSSTNWQTAATIIGDGTTKSFGTSINNGPQLFIRVKLQ